MITVNGTNIERKCKKSKDSQKRRCYAVKVSIDKNQKGKVQPPSCPPAPLVSPLPPLRNSVRLCCACEPAFRTKTKPRSCRSKKQERDCQTLPYPHPCRKAEIETQCSISPPKRTQDSHCQTVHKELKHCGHQVSESCEKGTKHCQTELENACCAVGVPHTKQCCKNNEKQDASQQTHTNNICNTMKVNNCLPKTHEKCSNQAACERKYDFPFVGRTASGNLKVRPSMISYENKEFGILVANRNSIRTTVKRIISSDTKLREEKLCPPPTPPCPPAGFTNNFCYREICSSTSSPRGSCIMAEHKFPPHHHQNFRCNQLHTYCDRCSDLESVVPSYHNEKSVGGGRMHIPLEPMIERAHVSDRAGHIDAWKFVNPKYPLSRKERGRGEKSSRITHLGEGETPGGWEGYLDTGMREWETENDHTDTLHYNSHNPGGTHNSELAEKRGKAKPKAGTSDRSAPYIPAFPQEKTQQPHQQPHQRPNMSNGEGFHTPDQHRSDSEYDAEHSSIVSDNQHRPEYNTFTNEQHIEAHPDMIGKLHYVVKGTVDPDAKVKIGDAVFPVHSVVLEILSKLPDDNYPQMDYQNGRVKLPDFDSLPIRNYKNEAPYSDNHIAELEDEACMTSNRESRTCTRNLKGGRSNEHVIDQSCKLPPFKHRERNQDLATRSRLPPGYYKHPNKRDHPQDLIPCPIEVKSSGVQKTTPKVDLSRALKDEKTEKLSEEPVPTVGSVVAEAVPPERVAGSTDTIGLPIPTTTPLKPRKSSKQLQTEEMEIDPNDGILPNLDVIKGVILVFGGLNPVLPCTTDNGGKDVCMYTPDTDEWTEIGVLPNPRTHFGLARVNNDIYVIGGNDPAYQDDHGKNLAVITTYRLNLRVGKWEVLPGMKKARSHFGCVAIGTKIYIIGGNIESRATASCLMFDTNDQSWREIASLPSTRSNMGIVVFKGGILVAGGTSRDAKKPVLETVAYYQPFRNSWTAWGNLPSPRAFCSLDVVNNQIYLIAGAGLKDVNKRKNTSLDDVLIFSEKSNKWVEAGRIHHARHAHATAVLDGQIVVIAGVSSLVLGPINTVEIWSASSHNSKKVNDFRHSRSGMAAITL